MEKNQNKLHEMKQRKQEISIYLSEKINSFIQPMVYDIVKHRPADPEQFAIQWLKNHIAERSKPTTETESECDYEDEEPYFETKFTIKQKIAKKTVRRGISEEVYGNFNAKTQAQLRCIPKNQESLIRNSILFQNLDENDQNIVIDAMEEKNVQEKDIIIKEGDKGDTLYIVAEGDFDCSKVIQNQEKYLKTYTKGEAFGELALMYNAPRAATIVARNAGKLFCLDRVTFSQIVKLAAIKKRQNYEQIMKKVQIFSQISQCEREQLYDVLKPQKHNDGDYIIRQGDSGNQFYIVVEGKLVAEKLLQNETQPKIVYEFKEGDYFGELALLNDQPRQASIKAVGKVQVACIDRQAFRRLLGSLQDILKRNQQRYVKSEEAL